MAVNKLITLMLCVKMGLQEVGCEGMDWIELHMRGAGGGHF